MLKVTTVELAPSGFVVKSFPRQSRSRGGGIATAYKSTLGSNITFKANFDFTHTSFEVVQASIILQHNTLHFFCLYRLPPNRRNNITYSTFTEQLPDLLDYVNNLPGFVCLVSDMNIHFDNPLQSLTKQTLTTLSLYSLDHTMFVHRLHTVFGFTDTVLQWFSSYLTDRSHYFSLCNHCSDFAPVHSSVPQGSVLGPMLFTMYIKPLSAIIDSIIHHSFADDLQLQMSAPPDRISELLHSMQSCICDVKAWSTANMLKLNDSKTELMLVTSKRSKHLHNLPTSITIGNAQIPFKQSVKKLGFTLDCHLTMNAHVSNIARTCYFELRRLASIRRFLTSTATATLVSAFVLSRIDYCNSLLFGSTHDVTSHLQRIQNYAARVILRLPMSSSITIHLK